MAFARTKIQRPQRRPGTHIDRPALEQRVGQALLTQRLVLLCAAAGFGKTSVLARQAELLPEGTALAWIACDEGDTPAQLFECLVDALEPFDPPWRTAPGALMRAAAEAASAEQRRAVAAEVINALDACEVEHGVIVIDDLHRAEHPAVLAFIDDLLQRFTPRWTLAIATRREPALALARLRAIGELAEFRLDDLRFNAAEAARFMAIAGASGEDPASLHRRTQGWPVGLRLALNARAASQEPDGVVPARAVIDRHVFDFLADEVIDPLEPGLREFLLTTSVLPELSASRCAALSGDPQAGLRLEEIERAGLFATPIAADEPTLRLHDLFREALETRFARERPEQFNQALRRAAATEPDPVRRVSWLQRAQAWQEAEAALAEAVEELVESGAAAQVRTLFERFPAPQREASARLQMLLASSVWDWDPAIEAATRAAAGFAAQGAAQDRLTALSYLCRALSGANHHERARELARELLREPALSDDALARTLTAASWVEAPRGDQRELAPLWERLLETLPRTSGLARWTECAPLSPLIGLPGLRPLMQRYVVEARRRLPEHPTLLRGLCHATQAWLQFMAADIEAAESSAATAAADARWLAQQVALATATASLQALLQAVRGNGAAAQAMMQGVIGKIEASGVPVRIEVYLSAYQFMAMRCAALVDDAQALREHASRLVAVPAGGRSWMSPQQLASAGAYLMLVDGRLDAACQRWREMLDDEFRGDILGQKVETWLRLADGLLRSGAGAAQAGAALVPLFEQLRASGEIGKVLMAGPKLLRRLALADWKGSLSAAQQAELAAWSALSNGLVQGTRPGAAAITMPESGAAPEGGPLTTREFEVLAAMAAGDSNKLIARALDLSPHTVKRHVANILDKLNLATRGQAAAWYRARH
jgi:LuxR family transcriptional regulator, maltose regulon positive regulatory protein